MFPIVPFFPPMIGAADMNLRTWETALADLVAQAPRIIVPGHGNLGGTEIADQVRSYLADTRKLVASSGVSKPATTEALHQLEAQVRGRHPTWERTEFIAPALRYFMEERAGG